MSQSVQLELEMPDDLARFALPTAVNHRLQALLDRQNAGEDLTLAERGEAEGLVNLAELLSLLKLRMERFSQTQVVQPDSAAPPSKLCN